MTTPNPRHTSWHSECGRWTVCVDGDLTDEERDALAAFFAHQQRRQEER